jgi:hypothetical protein
VGTRGTRSEHLETDLAEMELLPAPKTPDMHAVDTDCLSKLSIGGQFPSGGTLPKLPHLEIANHRRQASQVIEVRMREDYGVQASHSEAKQCGNDDPLSHIERGIERSPAVDEESFAIGKLQQKCIPVTHIEGR